MSQSHFAKVPHGGLAVIMAAPLVLAPFLAIGVYLSYWHSSPQIVWISLPLVVVFLVCVPFLARAVGALRYDISRSQNVVGLEGFFWVLVLWSVLWASFVEYWYFGVPLLGRSLYSSFGFPLLHHISVSSWLFVFFKYRSRFLCWLGYGFAFFNPILMLNRDLLLLTLFVLGFKLVATGMFRVWHVVLVGAFSVFAFVSLGYLRSGDPASYISLPFRAAFDGLSGGGFWIFTYLTGPTFNVAYNIDLFGQYLFDSLVNVFPEYYGWYLSAGLVGYYLFFVSCFLVVWLVVVSGLSYRVPLLAFLTYQYYMSVAFGSKFFVSHTLFVFLVFLAANLALRLRKRNLAFGLNT